MVGDIDGVTAFLAAAKRKSVRFPGKNDGRCLNVVSGGLAPNGRAGFKIAAGETVFTVGSCFAREVEAIRQEVPQVDYFPSYEIALSFGVSGYQDDNIHLRPEVIEQIMAAMRRTYF